MPRGKTLMTDGKSTNAFNDRLSEDDGFTESTNDDVCTQYSTADCTRY